MVELRMSFRAFCSICSFCSRMLAIRFERMVISWSHTNFRKRTNFERENGRTVGFGQRGKKIKTLFPFIANCQKFFCFTHTSQTRRLSVPTGTQTGDRRGNGAQVKRIDEKVVTIALIKRNMLNLLMPFCQKVSGRCYWDGVLDMLAADWTN